MSFYKMSLARRSLGKRCMLKSTLFNEWLECMSDKFIALSIASPGQMVRLNRRWRGKSGSTDTLAFELEGDDCIGHIYYCPQRAIQKRFPWWNSISNNAIRFHLIRTMAHSVAHLHGYEHGELEEYRQMLRYENKLIHKVIIKSR